MNTNLRNQILEKFRDKEYRDAFVAEYIFSRIPLKIRAMRDARSMSQGELGQLAGIAQPWVSKLEDPTYGRLTISTLLKIASAFDVALYVDFVPFSDILNRSTNLSKDAFVLPSFENDLALVPAVQEPLRTRKRSRSALRRRRYAVARNTRRASVTNIGEYSSQLRKPVPSSLGTMLPPVRTAVASTGITTTLPALPREARVLPDSLVQSMNAPLSQRKAYGPS